MAEKTRSSILVSIIKDIMKDGKERTLAEIRKEIQSRQNLVYKKDYTEGVFSGVIRSMKLSGLLYKTEYGCYVYKPDADNAEQKERAFNEYSEPEEAEEICKKPFELLLAETQQQLEKQYNIFIQKIKKNSEVDLTQLSESELQNALHLLKIKRYYEDLIHAANERNYNRS